MLFTDELPVYYENFDLQNIITPVKAEVLVSLLKEMGYDANKIKFLEDGFTNGFDIGYQGPETRQSESNNIPLRVGSKTELWNKLMKEVKAKRVAGPFDQIPYQNYIQSPLGLVPKAGDSGQTRLIFHLSYNFDDQQELSLNHYTPRELCSTKYRDLDFAVNAYPKIAGWNQTEQNAQSDKQPTEEKFDVKGNKKTIYGGKTDVKSAFRLVPLRRQCWKWLIMKAQDPQTGKFMYFIDKCLPFGASISCSIFQKFSDALKYLVEYQATAKNPNSFIVDTITNYLDDFLFLALTLSLCNELIEEFLKLCDELGVPVAAEKTEWGQKCIVFLGILLDGEDLVMRIPLEKRTKALNLLNRFVDKKKATVKELQELCGYLNFLCKAIFPGRTFIRRMYAKFSKVMNVNGGDKAAESCNRMLKPHHHVRLDSEFKSDCKVWIQFLDQDSELASIVNRPMIDILSPDLTSSDITFYSDASASSTLGFGCLYRSNWIRGDWDTEFIK